MEVKQSIFSFFAFMVMSEWGRVVECGSVMECVSVMGCSRILEWDCKKTNRKQQLKWAPHFDTTTKQHTGNWSAWVTIHLILVIFQCHAHQSKAKLSLPCIISQKGWNVRKMRLLRNKMSTRSCLNNHELQVFTRENQWYLEKENTILGLLV